MTTQTQLSSKDNTYTVRYKYKIVPTKDQEEYLAKVFGHSRFVFNEVLFLLKLQYQVYIDSNKDPRYKPDHSMSGVSRLLNILKSEYEWLQEVSSVALQQSANNITKAYKDTFNRAKKTKKYFFPRYKNRHDGQSVRFVRGSFGITNNQELRIGLLKTPIKVYWSRDLPSDPSSITVSQTPDGKYHVSFVVQVTPKKTSGTGIVGIDLGLTDLYTDSNGNHIANDIKLTKRTILTRIKKLQVYLAKKTKGSKNYQKLRLKIAKLFQKATNIQNDMYHKLSRRLVDENQAIVIEDLNVKGMLSNHCLAQTISFTGWSKLVQYIYYKVTQSQHCILGVADTYYPSSKLCNACGSKTPCLKLSDREWVCQDCETHHNRDENAAFNLRDLFVREIKLHAAQANQSFIDYIAYKVSINERLVLLPKE